MGRGYMAAAFFSAALLAGCMPLQPVEYQPPTAADVQKLTEVERSVHRSAVTLAGPQEWFDVYNNYRLRAWNQEGSPEWELQLYVVAHLDSWAFLDRAMRFGVPIEVTVIDRSPIGYGVYETVGLPMDRQLMEQLIAVGKSYEVEIFGRAGSVIVAVSPAYMSGFLAVLDATPKF